MCESTAVLKGSESEEIIQKEVALIRTDGDKITIYGMLGDRREVRGAISEIDFMAHKIVIIPKI